MGKIEAVLNDLSDLNRAELQQVLFEAQRLFEAMRPVRIKEVFKKCNKPDCTCQYGDVNEYGHGPYLYAVWSEGKGQSRKQRSLGRRFSQSEIERIRAEPAPQWFDFVLSKQQIAKLANKWDAWERTLGAEDFEAFYGLPVDEDRLNRPRELKYHRGRYEIAYQKWQDMQEVVGSEFADLGVGTRKGYLDLKELTDKGYYLVVGSDNSN